MFGVDVLFGCVLAVALAHLAAVTYLRRRCRRREPWLRHLVRRSSLLALYNVFVYACSAAGNQPVLDVAALPEMAPVQRAWHTIRDEALGLVRDGRVSAPAWNNDPAIQTFYALGWKRFYLKWHSDFLPSAVVRCPRTIELLRTIPTLRGAMFAVLPAGARLAAHTDPFAGTLRYHLGLCTPNSPACAIQVDTATVPWRDGRVLVFDETFLHEVRNDTDRERLILFCDVERPLRWRWAATANRAVRHVLMLPTAIQNDDGDPAGIISRVAGALASCASRLATGRPQSGPRR